MSRNVLVAIYVVIGLLMLVVTAQRVLAGQWARALISGAILGFCGWRLYRLFGEPSAAD